MKSIHKNVSLTRCGLFINKEHPFLHATLDYLTQCDCCGLGCGEVKNPLTLENGDFEKYATHKHSCLEKKDDKFALKRTHNYYIRFSNSYLHYLKENRMTLLYVELMQMVTPIFSQSVSYLTLSTGTEWCQNWSCFGDYAFFRKY